MSPNTMPSAPRARPAKRGARPAWGGWLATGIWIPRLPGRERRDGERCFVPVPGPSGHAPSVGGHHLLGPDVLVEVLGLDETELRGGLPEGDVLLVRQLRHL